MTTAPWLSTNLRELVVWAENWPVTFNPTRIKSYLTSLRVNMSNHPPIYMHYQQTEKAETSKDLGSY